MNLEQEESITKSIRQGIINELKSKLPTMRHAYEGYKNAHLYFGDGIVTFHLYLDTATIHAYRKNGNKLIINLHDENFIEIIQSELILSDLENTRSRLIHVGGADREAVKKF